MSLPHYANKVWFRWKKGFNTAEIARKLDQPECEVDRIIARCLDAKYSGRKMPWLAA